jgi:hypothetical protein
MRYRAGFAYVDGVLADGQVLRLCRLRYVGSASRWGFAIYRASHDDYEDNYLPSGSPTGSAEEAPRLRLQPLPERPEHLDPGPPTFQRRRPLSAAARARRRRPGPDGAVVSKAW